MSHTLTFLTLPALNIYMRMRNSLVSIGLIIYSDVMMSSSSGSGRGRLSDFLGASNRAQSSSHPLTN